MTKEIEEEEEEEEEEETVEKGRCICVAVQIDNSGRELLTWALSTITREGDRVVALHISRVSDFLHASTQSSIKALDDFISEFKDLCTLKQVTLVGRVSRGISIRWTLVKEAVLCAANTVVVGANYSFSLGGSASVAKYCAKKLPTSTALFAFHNGNVFLERNPSVAAILGKDTNATITSCKSQSDDDSPRSGSTEENDEGLRSQFDDDSPRSVSTEENNEGLNDRRIVVYKRTAESNLGSISILVRKLPEPKPGWPLLRRAVAANIEALKDSEARNMSVVQWVMSLPNRSLLSIEAAPDDLVEELSNVLHKNSAACKWFQYEELKNSTNNFSAENLIGKGGSGQVYKGCLTDGQKVAIKLSELSKENSRDFLLEVEIITKLQHERIVPLIGLCIEQNHFLSVYSHFSKGSLEKNLHGKRSKTPLAWEKRFNIAVGVAEALSYLHNGCSQPVIHRDIKSSNILLDDEFEPQISDFGLALWAPTNSLFQTESDIVGTFGYLAPEYFMYGKVSSKIDVYAYGVVLLELLTGRKPISDESPKGQESLVMWATPVLERGDLKELVDPDLDGNYEENELHRMVLVASLCIARVERLRPQINQVLDLLKGKEDIESWIKSKSSNPLENLDCQDEEICPSFSIGSHISLAFLDVEDDDASMISFDQNHLSSLNNYWREPWSHSPSVD